MKRTIAFLAPLLGILLLSVPADAANREHQQLAADVRMLQEQTQQLQAMLGALNESLRAVTAKLDEQVGINRKAFADSRLLVDNVGGDVRIVREKIDDTNVRISTLTQEIEALRQAIPPPQPVAPPTLDPNAAAAMDPSAPPPPAAPTTSGVGTTPQKLYDTAYADYMAGQWSLAIQGFDSYIKAFPRSELADDAQHYIGEAYYADGKFEDAVAAYDEVIKGYPRADMVPASSYKKGLALERLGQIDRAREAFQFVVKNFPESNSAVLLSKQALDRLSRQRR